MRFIAIIGGICDVMTKEMNVVCQETTAQELGWGAPRQVERVKI